VSLIVAFRLLLYKQQPILTKDVWLNNTLLFYSHLLVSKERTWKNVDLHIILFLRISKLVSVCSCNAHFIEIISSLKDHSRKNKIVLTKCKRVRITWLYASCFSNGIISTKLEHFASIYKVKIIYGVGQDTDRSPHRIVLFLVQGQSDKFSRAFTWKELWFFENLTSWN